MVFVEYVSVNSRIKAKSPELKRPVGKEEKIL